jgi:hypothetical protein
MERRPAIEVAKMVDVHCNTGRKWARDDIPSAISLPRSNASRLAGRELTHPRQDTGLPPLD